mgnify:CR=1 FL=1
MLKGIIMKILQVIPVFSLRFGGPVAVVRSISKELAKKHDVTVYTTCALDQRRDFRSEPFEVKTDGYRVVYFPRILKFSRFNVSPAMASALRETLHEYDVIHLHSWRHFQDIAVHHYARKYGIPYVLQTHGSLPRVMAWRRLKLIYDTLFGIRLLRDASKVIALNKTEAQQYRGMGVPEEKIKIIPNGIDLSEYDDLPPKGTFKKKFGIDKDERIVLYLGRIHQSKGLDLLAKAFSIVTKELDKVRLVVIGPDDGYVAKFLKLLSDLEITNKVLMTGFVEKRDKIAALVDSDVFVTPSFYGFPVTFLEACLAGCPIVTTSNELDWIHNNVGYITKNSPIALAKAIYNILQNETVREKIRNNCKVTIKNFDISTIASLLEDTYKSVMKSHA